MQTILLAAALAGSVALPVDGLPTHELVLPAVSVAQSAPDSLLGFRRGAGGKLSLQQQLTAQSALAVTLSSGSRRDLPQVRVMVGVQYSF